MNSSELWLKFEHSGRVQDYLAFKAQKEKEEQHDLHNNGSGDTGALRG